jgi:DNA-binding NtrC family response regulator
MKFTENGHSPAMPTELLKALCEGPGRLCGGRSSLNLTTTEQPVRVVALFSADDALSKVVQSAIEAPWRLERCIYGDGLIAFLRLSDVRLAIIDDQSVAERERGWLLAQVRKHLPKATLLYIAAAYTAENERRARGNGACYYTAKPIHHDHLANVLKAFLEQLA